MKMKRLLTCALILVAAAANAQTVDEVIHKYLAAIGGVDKWKAVKSRKAEGKMTMQGFDLPVTLYQKPPAKQKVVVSIQGMEIVQAFDGKDAWAINPMVSKDPVKIPEEESKDMRDNQFENDFIDYKKKGHEVKLLGTEVVDGIKCYKVELVKNKNKPGASTEIHFFDADNYVTIMQSAIADSGPVKGKEVKTFLSDYQDVQGLMLPFAIETKIGEETLQKFVFEKVSIDEPMDDSLFAFPKK
jgi:outer membrane lipoprotein-sorting protein